MKRWEYRVIEIGAGLLGSDGLNKLGAEGWELVAAVPKTELGITGSVCLIFKREAQLGLEGSKRR
jgi:hypothetical protein